MKIDQHSYTCKHHTCKMQLIEMKTRTKLKVKMEKEEMYEREEK